MKTKFTFLLSLVLLFSSFSAFAGVIDPAPAPVTVPAALRIGSDMSAWYSDKSTQVFTVNDTKIENTAVLLTGYLEYKITAATAGNYIVTISASNDKAGATFNVDTYAEGGTFQLNPTKTKSITKGGWSNFINYDFTITLAANTTTILRITLMNNNNYVCNINGINITDGPVGRIAPIVVVPGALQLATDLSTSYTDDATATFTIGDALIENTQVATTGYLEYKLVATKTRDYAVTISAATQQNGASMNVAAYIEGESFVLDAAKNQAITNAGSGVFSNYTFTIRLTENTTTTMRITLMNTNNTVCNINGITLAEVIPVTIAPAAIVLKDGMYASSNVTELANTGLGGIRTSGYAEYQIKSPTAGTHIVTILAATTATDATLNVGTYDIGGTFVLDANQTQAIANSGSYTTDLTYTYSITLAANTTKIMRLTFAAASWTCNIHGISIAKDGTTSTSLNITDNIKVYAANGVLNVNNVKSFVNGTVEVMDITGRRIASQTITEANCQMSLNNKGMYIARILDANNETVKTSKFIVK